MMSPDCILLIKGVCVEKAVYGIAMHDRMAQISNPDESVYLE